MPKLASLSEDEQKLPFDIKMQFYQDVIGAVSGDKKLYS